MTCGDYPPGVTGNERHIRGWDDDEMTCENFEFDQWRELLAEDWFGEDELRDYYNAGETAPDVDRMACKEIEDEKFHSERYEL